VAVKKNSQYYYLKFPN